MPVAELLVVERLIELACTVCCFELSIGSGIVMPQPVGQVTLASTFWELIAAPIENKATATPALISPLLVIFPSSLERNELIFFFSIGIFPDKLRLCILPLFCKTIVYGDCGFINVSVTTLSNCLLKILHLGDWLTLPIKVPSSTKLHTGHRPQKGLYAQESHTV